MGIDDSSPISRDVWRRLTCNRGAVAALARRHHARSVRVFGSVARGEAGPESDLDLLVEWAPEATLFDWVRLQRALSELLEMNVQITDADRVHWAIRDRVLKEARPA